MQITPRIEIESHNPVPHGGSLSVKNLGSGIVDFSSNISPAGMPKNVKKTMKKKLSLIEHYPDMLSSNLISRLGKFTNMPKSNILVGNGAVEIIYNFSTSFLPKKHVLIPIPTFGEYEAAARLANCKISFFKTMNLLNDINSFMSKIPINGCVFLCNPNNPTGTIIPRNQLKTIISNAEKKSCIVFVDECFIELVPGENQSVLKLIKKFSNLFVLRSLTKSFGLAGIRLGYGVSSKRVVDVLQKTKIPWSVNSLAQEAGLIALNNKNHIKNSQAIIESELNFLKNKIEKIEGFECRPSATNFMLIKTDRDSTKLQQQLLKRKILIRDCKNIRGLDNHFIRVAVKTHNDNIKLIRALKAV